MTVALPDLPPWNAANWVVRGFCDHARPLLGDFPLVRGEIEEALESELWHLDFAAAPAETLGELHRLVALVIANNLVRGGSDFHDPAGFPGYLDKLHELERLVAQASVNASARVAGVGQRTVAGGRVILGEAIASGSTGAVFLGSLADDPVQRRIVTVTGRQTVPLSLLRGRLGLEVAGIVPLEYLGPVDLPDSEGWSGDCAVEIAPRGEPVEIGIDERAALPLMFELAELLGRAHGKGLVILGIRPELVYGRPHPSGGVGLAGVAPRAPLFLDTAAPSSSGARAMAEPYRAPEDLILTRPEPRSDVFCLCATLWHLVGGRHPFGTTPPEQLQRIHSGALEPWNGSEELGAVLRAGLEPDPIRRLTVDELTTRLARLG
jgi:hypothetical protein